MKKMVIWPANLTAGRTGGEGRTVSRRNAVKSPRVEEIEKVVGPGKEGDGRQGDKERQNPSHLTVLCAPGLGRSGRIGVVADVQRRTTEQVGENPA